MQLSPKTGSRVPSAKPLSTSQRSLLAILFDTRYYEAQAAINAGDTDDLVSHYLRYGWRKGLNPSATFRAARYLNSTSGLRDSGKNPFAHYLFEKVGEAALTGAFAGLSTGEVEKLRAHFDANWYFHCYPDVEVCGDDPFIHYMVSGWRGLRDPSPRFSTSSYLERYLDIRDCGINPFQHWVFHGLAEGRLARHEMLSPLNSWDSLSASQQSILVHLFSIDYYRLSVVASRPGHGLPIAEYVSSGLTGGADPTPSFRACRYIAAHPELYDVDRIPFLHFLFDKVGESALLDIFVGLTSADAQDICEHFDTAWYLYSYPDIEASGVDAFIHYMVFGWLERRDPSPDFSTFAYLSRYPDIAECGINPFRHWVLHGKTEGRSGASSNRNFRDRPYSPSVTAVLINSEATPLSPGCLTAVLEQSYGDLTFLVIGAPLPEASRMALNALARGDRGKAVAYLAEDGRHSQWRLLERAVEDATAELLWFVQGHGVHEVDFLARLVSSFADGSVQLGFGRSLEQDDNDPIRQNQLVLNLDGWKRHLTCPAAVWFRNNLRPDTLAAQQYSFLWRRRELSDDVWSQAEGYRHLGLWHLYLHIASGGQIASVRDAMVRVPSLSQVALDPLTDAHFYDDVARLAAEVRSFWDVPRAALEACGDALANARALHMGSYDAAPLNALYDVDRLFEIDRVKRHVLLVTHGIFAGGAENFPLQLANELAKHRIIVSMLIFKTDDVNAEMRATLNPGVSIYEAEWVLEHGCDKFLDDIACSLIHSHGVVSEMFFFDRCHCTLRIPYVATLHGSYEASTSKDLPENVIDEIVRRVDLFVYTADKNLKPLLRHGVKSERLVKMINAMPIDKAAFPQTREGLGIAEDAVVFTLVARGIKEKGWSTAINAFKAVQKKEPQRSMHLCLVGEGDEPDRLRPLFADDPSISFLGFQLRIHGLYRMTDVAVVPSRFAGESYPLCVIQALQVAVPVIATDVGEIASMLQNDGVAGGIIVKCIRDDKRFEMRFTRAMQDLLDDDRRKQLGLGAGILGKGYDMSGLTKQYVDLYEHVLLTFAAESLTDLTRQAEPSTPAL